MQEFKDKVQMRGNVTQALASLSVSSLQDAAQISSALAHSTVSLNLFMISEKDRHQKMVAIYHGLQAITKGLIIYPAIVLCARNKLKMNKLHQFFMSIKRIFTLLQAVTSEIQCGECTSRVVEAVGKMINMIREQTRQGDVTPIDTGRNILNVLSMKFPYS